MMEKEAAAVRIYVGGLAPDASSKVAEVGNYLSRLSKTTLLSSKPSVSATGDFEGFGFVELEGVPCKEGEKGYYPRATAPILKAVASMNGSKWMNAKLIVQVAFKPPFSWKRTDEEPQEEHAEEYAVDIPTPEAVTPALTAEEATDPTKKKKQTGFDVLSKVAKRQETCTVRIRKYKGGKALTIEERPEEKAEDQAREDAEAAAAKGKRKSKQQPRTRVRFTAAGGEDAHCQALVWDSLMGVAPASSSISGRAIPSGGDRSEDSEDSDGPEARKERAERWKHALAAAAEVRKREREEDGEEVAVHVENKKAAPMHGEKSGAERRGEIPTHVEKAPAPAATLAPAVLSALSVCRREEGGPVKNGVPDASWKAPKGKKKQRADSNASVTELAPPAAAVVEPAAPTGDDDEVKIQLSKEKDAALSILDALFGSESPLAAPADNKQAVVINQVLSNNPNSGSKRPRTADGAARQQIRSKLARLNEEERGGEEGVKHAAAPPSHIEDTEPAAAAGESIAPPPNPFFQVNSSWRSVVYGAGHANPAHKAAAFAFGFGGQKGKGTESEDAHRMLEPYKGVRVPHADKGFKMSSMFEAQQATTAAVHATAATTMADDASAQPARGHGSNTQHGSFQKGKADKPTKPDARAAQTKAHDTTRDTRMQAEAPPPAAPALSMKDFLSSASNFVRGGANANPGAAFTAAASGMAFSRGGGAPGEGEGGGFNAISAGQRKRLKDDYRWKSKQSNSHGRGGRR